MSDIAQKKIEQIAQMWNEHGKVLSQVSLLSSKMALISSF
jgi:hypothetical protein